MRVHAAHPRGHGPRGLGIEVDDLRHGMHAGVGTAGSDNADWVTGDLADGVLERILDATARRLRLEAAERASRVFDRQRDAHARSM